MEISINNLKSLRKFVLTYYIVILGLSLYYQNFILYFGTVGCLLLYVIFSILQRKKIVPTEYLHLFLGITLHTVLGIILIDCSFITYLLGFVPLMYCLAYLHHNKEYKYYIWIAGILVVCSIFTNKFIYTSTTPDVVFTMVNIFYSIIICILSMDIFYHHVVLKEVNLAISNSKYEEQAIHDELTGLLNRHAFKTRYKSFIDAKLPFTIVMCDIDDFKDINDKYGHLAGDTVLKELSKIFLENVRGYDDVYRWGGEEFLIILQTNQANAITVMERIRQLVEETTFKYEKKNMHITISIGITQFRQDFDDITIISATDSVLYKSKQEGKNKITIYQELL